MSHQHVSPEMPLPKAWPARVRSAVLCVISLAQYAVVFLRGRAAASGVAILRLKAEIERLEQEVALLQEEIRIKDARMTRIDPHKRPHFSPTDRMAILELRAARCWSQQQTADVFQISAATIASWHKRLDEDGPEALVQLREPVNRFPEFVRYLVQRLKLFCPALGKVKIAQVLARAGLHLAPSTVGRILKQPSTPKPAPTKQTATRIPTAKHPNHVWHVDLTTVPTSQGFWTAWLPLALPQCWPCCWWVAVAIDHYSRRVMGVAVFKTQPTSEMVRAFLGRAIRQAGKAPRYIISDKGSQFWCSGFKRWCNRRGIRPRFGAVGKQGSIAVVERFIRTLKEEGTRRLLVPLRRETFRSELLQFAAWYNGHRPHTWLKGRTPDEVYHASPPANEQPRIEPRLRWPLDSPCARPRAPVDGKPGAVVEFVVVHVAGRKHLSIVTLRRVAQFRAMLRLLTALLVRAKPAAHFNIQTP